MNLSDKRKARARYQLKKNNKGGLPRLVVNRTLKNIYAQIVCDKEAKTLCSFSTKSKDFKAEKTYGIEAAKLVGAEIAKLAKKEKISKVIFDKSGVKYHGRVKALADAARENGLEF
ncbi:MAG: 50S ribosomal protein L18 [Alphaproteobacteria bacterium]|jgi:large subunit ribosomal protein L18|nr:50S ribosomal protein L18 [Alphaproteobacteria bacterium]